VTKTFVKNRIFLKLYLAALLIIVACALTMAVSCIMPGWNAARPD